ncbi:MAG TPA: trypsin-like peptidase domain-containing protein [Kineosporiaceae bacterium]|nr:trypsin-like peptidase domain-containing protein [Kineosporiaceae bacterium]
MPTTTDPWTETGTPATTADDHPAGYPAGAAMPIPHGGDRRGPGRRGMIAVAAGAAVLASLVTTVSLNAFGSPTSASASPAAQQSAPLVTGGATAPNWVAIAAAVKPSVVSVRVQAADGGGGQGSGVVLDTTGRVLTNNHVVAGAGAGGTISVLLSDGRAYAATVVGADPATDLAVIAIKQAPSGLVPATFADSSTVQVGDAVMAIGNPLGLSSTATTGVVSALNRPVTTSQEPQQGSSGQAQPQGEQVVTNAIQTDAAVNPGNSGGALVDSAGRVIGITSSIASLGAPQGSQPGSIGLGFAIPANEAKDVANQLITTGRVQHAYLGVTLADGTVTVDGAQREAAVVGTVAPGTPAATAGLQAKDSIIAINGQPVQGADSLVAQVRAQHPGTTIDLSVVRAGRQQTVHLTLAVRPATTG